MLKEPRKLEKSNDYFAELRLPSIPINNSSSILIADQYRKLEDINHMKPNQN